MGRELRLPHDHDSDSDSSLDSSSDVADSNTPLKEPISLQAKLLNLSQKGTPVSQRPNTSDATLPDNALEGERNKYLRKAVRQETFGRTLQVSAQWAATQFKKLVPDDIDIEEWLINNALYDSDNQQWIGSLSDGTATGEEDTYNDVAAICNSIIRSLGRMPSQGTVSRNAVVTNSFRLAHVEDFKNCNYYSQPDIVIVATGNSFEAPKSYDPSDPDTFIGFSNIAGIIEVKFKPGSASPQAQLEQVGVYVRYVKSSPFTMPT